MEEIRVCRTCLKEENGRQFTPIFANKQVPLNIFLISQVSIIENDRIPAIICDFCLEELTRLMKFRCNIMKADEYFRKNVTSTDINSWKQKEPQVLIKTESEEIKNEPNDSNYDMMENIEMIFDTSCTPFNDPVDSDNGSDFNSNDYLSRKRRRGRNDINYIEADERKISCNLCMRTFVSKSSKQEHMRALHYEMSDELFKCNQCNKSFKNQIYLNRHSSRVHSKNVRSLKRIDSKRRDSALYCEVA
jgi:uncharacterized protein with PIN domain